MYHLFCARNNGNDATCIPCIYVTRDALRAMQLRRLMPETHAPGRLQSALLLLLPLTGQRFAVCVACEHALVYTYHHKKRKAGRMCPTYTYNYFPIHVCLVLGIGNRRLVVRF